MAQTFRFRLETVRRLRRMELDARRREVAEATREVSAVDLRIAKLTDTARANVGQIKASQSGGAALDLPRIRMHYVHQGYLARQMMEAELCLAKRQNELNARRSRLNEANAKAKAIDKLHERQKQRFDQWQRNMQQKEMDEQALRVHAAGSVGEQW